MTFARAQRIADAVLLEGYVLYPYRACSTKNQYRWTFGVLCPKSWSEAGGCEPWWLEAQVLVEGRGAVLSGRLRFLHVVERRVERHEGGRFQAVERLDVGGRTRLSWEEGEVREVDFQVALGEADAPRAFPFALEPRSETELLHDDDGSIAGRIVRTAAGIWGDVHVRVERIDGGLSRVSLRVENRTPYHDLTAPRSAAVRASCVSTHLLLSLESGAFVSLLDPSPETRDAAASCRSVHTYPVLAGEEGRRDLLLCAPIVLHDHPQIAPESPGDFFDACEIDELLALRTKTLTPEEKARARETDPRAAALVDRVEAMTEEELMRLHGAVRDGPGSAGTRRFAAGMRVRLRPDGSRRRTDIQDFLFVGRTATIEAIRQDVDGHEFLAVTIDDDPAAELHRAKGRFHYYYPDEVDLL